jgi:23S rRNA (adenine2503-C2)-methyltransferase
MAAALRPLLRDIPPAALDTIVADCGEPAYRAAQLRHWLYAGGAVAWEALSNLPVHLRYALAESYDITGLELRERQVSSDGTRKFLFALRDGHTVESVVIPMGTHLTYCLSSQVGCAMACSFCATARGGLVRNLSAGEILEQALRLDADVTAEPVEGYGDRGFNIVYMGMGEPLDNLDGVLASIDAFTAVEGLGLSTRRITVSTSGHPRGLGEFVARANGVGLTLSVNGCTPELRKRLMPVPGRTPLKDVLDLGERYALRLRRPVTVAYVLIDGVNDDESEARRLAALVRNRPFKVNLIPMNRIDERYAPPSKERILAFQAVLFGLGVRAPIRDSGGKDIAAACGQLREQRRRGGGE